MKKTKEFLAILFAILFFLTGCANLNQADPVTNSPSSTPQNTVKELFTDESNNPLYIVVYPENAPKYIRDMASVLCEQLCKVTGALFEKSDDSIPPSSKAGEILIGRTNREDSKVDLSENEYVLQTKGKNIVIIGANDYSTAVAIDEFQKLFCKDPSVIDDTFSIRSSPNTVYRVAVGNSKYLTLDIYQLIPFSNEPILERRIQTVAGATGINFRDDPAYGKVIVVASGTRAELLDFETGKQLWTTNSAASGGHGVELLPNGIVAVASSSGNAIRLFDVEGTPTKYTKITLTDAHAVLWDPKNEILWGLGKTELRAFKVTKEGKDKITVTEDMSRYSKLPTTSGHDLAPCYNDDNKLWVTVFDTFYLYDKTTGLFTRVVEGDNGLIHRRRVKGIGSFEDGSMVTTYPDELSTSYKTWTTERINFYFKCGGKLYYNEFKTPDMHYYKCRIVCTDYQ